ncbi:DUF2218 domain-containing protein [Sinisalibacter aestuarii]|uniref:DUF2218 domain-containing protein n=1 Tax=Sinisalibacter aestuarii TaxID=2949426 RepID=A0ABQ5LXM4_9RHOB|nr:DUF2218 domain-containing protein [Sinisalibacter aestuarii]GKY89136.1 hypothetical protein STA1M1_30050 [Sinisalibacter aestuarii]
MYVLTGTYATEHGSKYLQQLCKHFGHKIETSFTETEGACHFAFGTAHMQADGGGLTVRVELDDANHADQARSVIDKHLERFAFREDFKAMDWGQAEPA